MIPLDPQKLEYFILHEFPNDDATNPPYLSGAGNRPRHLEIDEANKVWRHNDCEETIPFAAHAGNHVMLPRRKPNPWIRAGSCGFVQGLLWAIFLD